jgi:hypothetical protein
MLHIELGARHAGDFIDRQRIHIGHHARSVFSSKPISG